MERQKPFSKYFIPCQEKCSPSFYFSLQKEIPLSVLRGLVPYCNAATGKKSFHGWVAKND
jgi:hypothetical protein